jgi:hypothetical protein
MKRFSGSYHLPVNGKADHGLRKTNSPQAGQMGMEEPFV